MVKAVFSHFVKMLAGVVVMLLLAALVLALWIDPNNYRDRISQLARERAGIELVLEGQLGWAFYPLLGFSASEVRVALTPGADTLVTIDDIAFGVALIPLLQGQVNIDALDINGMQVDLRIDKQGNANWQLPSDRRESADERGDNSSDTPKDWLQKLTVSRLRVLNSTVRYRDEVSGDAYTVELKQWLITDVQSGQAFPLTVDLVVNGLLDTPLPVTLNSAITVDASGQQINTTINKLDVATLRMTGQLALDNSGEQLNYTGNLAATPFNPTTLFSALQIEIPPMTDTGALTQARWDITFEGNESQVEATAFNLLLDDMSIAGKVAVVDLASQALRFALDIDRLNLDRYLTPSVAAPEKQTGAADIDQVNDALFPVDVLRPLNAEGTVRVRELIVSTLPVRDIQVSLLAKDGVIDMVLQGANLMQGSAAGEVSVDVRNAQPLLTTALKLDDIAIADMLDASDNAALFSGKTSLAMNAQAFGNTTETLLQQALGQLDIQGEELVLHGVSLNQIVLGKLRDQLGNFSLLFPDYQDKLPVTFKRDTQVQTLMAKMQIDKGHLIIPDVGVATGEGRLNLSGDIDVLQQGFNLRMAVMPDALADNKYLGETAWPVVCKGRLSTPVGDWCRPDGNAFESLLKTAAKQAVRDKSKEKLAKELGVKDSDAETAEEVVRERARSAEDQAKQKARDAFRKKLDELIKPKE